eukprot:4537716-Pyramimonas_sp.AAC.1
MTKLWCVARNALLLAQSAQKDVHDDNHRHEEFFVGDEVFLSTQRHHDYGRILYTSKQLQPAVANKFEPRYLGPFKIVGKPSTHAYELTLPASINIHPVIHIRYLLRPREAKRFPNRLAAGYRQQSILVDDNPEYE